MKEQLLFGVVIVTYNRLELLKVCLYNVLHQTRSFDLVTIVNNCSSDGTKQYLEENYDTDDKVDIINSETNLGGAGGFKIAIEAAYMKVDYILIIDDDAIIALDYLQNIINSMSDDVLAYSGTITTDGEIDTTHRRRIDSQILLTKKDVDESMYKQDFFDYDLSTFCGLLVSTSVIKKVGLPKDEYFIWYDDTEYSLRIRKYTKIRNINSAIINHKTKKNQSVKRLGWKSYYGYRNAIDMAKEFSSIPTLYCIYRYSYLFFRFVQYRLCSLFKRQNAVYYRYVAEMMLDVMKDSINNNLGKNQKYLPMNQPKFI